MNGYRDDMAKYAPSNEKNKVRECFNSIPAQLSKENKKFQYSLIKKRGTAEYFEGSLLPSVGKSRRLSLNHNLLRCHSEVEGVSYCVPASGRKRRRNLAVLMLIFNIQKVEMLKLNSA